MQHFEIFISLLIFTLWAFLTQSCLHSLTSFRFWFSSCPRKNKILSALYLLFMQSTFSCEIDFLTLLISIVEANNGLLTLTGTNFRRSDNVVEGQTCKFCANSCSIFICCYFQLNCSLFSSITGRAKLHWQFPQSLSLALRAWFLCLDCCSLIAHKKSVSRFYRAINS